ncbi:MAG: 30S ribosomal protein S8 [Verrucomicrobia bacterium]|jgi:small subunit ribosomal protein S8|nr:30S ribosomal protein S8 [Verrucomicrobiota bacterium]
MTDPIADMLARIRNAVRASLPTVSLPHSKLKEALARVLEREGYLDGVSVEGSKKLTLKLKLRYVDKVPAISGLRRVSKPGLRRYAGAGAIPKTLTGMGITILTTPRGVMAGSQAKRENVGGEVLCCVW